MALKTLPTIEIDDWLLRVLFYSDAPAIYEIFSDPRVTRYWGHERLENVKQAEKFIRQTHEGLETEKMLEWGIVHKEDNRVIGVCSFCDWDRSARSAEIGFALHRGLWGKGIMGRILPEFIRFGFKQYDLQRLIADVDPRNRSSISLLEKLGFRLISKEKGTMLVNNELQDSHYYVLQQDQFGSPL